MKEKTTREQARKTLADFSPLEKLLFIEEGLRLLENDLFYNIETESDRQTARKIQATQRALYKIYIKETWKEEREEKNDL